MVTAALELSPNDSSPVNQMPPVPPSFCDGGYGKDDGSKVEVAALLATKGQSPRGISGGVGEDTMQPRVVKIEKISRLHWSALMSMSPGTKLF